ncbi:laminin subunit alpha lam-3-like isoform X2 [Artemia franciscana]|uniref:laminin subunit alpha lam-3-like isoform X2 n=1 Tax=Artemia franciscana TaxID=6661 RepID=UPI0032DA0649
MKLHRISILFLGLLLILSCAECQKKTRRKKFRKNKSILGTQPQVSSFVGSKDEQNGLFPNIFNLASRATITANATCGDSVTEVYCKMVEHVFLRSPQCGICDDSAYDKSFRHPITNAIDGTPGWWQSPTLQRGPQFEWVTIKLDLHQVFQVAYIIVKSAISPRPGNWILERSLDDVNYKPWQYYAITDEECISRYGIEPKSAQGAFSSDTEVTCTSEFSKIHPLEDGEIHTSLVKARPGALIPSEELRNFTRARYVRLRLQKIRTLNADLMTAGGSDDNDDTLYRRFFYSIRDISIGGMCDCNGHAADCTENPNRKLLKCKCEHNTCGPSCSECCPMFNQYPWKCGTSKEAAVCQPCNCHGHARSCTYDSSIAKEKRSLDIHGKYSGGGVCQNCSDFTTGINCEKCLPGYFRPSGVSPTDKTPCFKCNCNPLGTIGQCISDDSGGLVPGSCRCKEGFGGIFCEQCAQGYRNYPNCEPCPCDPDGTEGSCDEGFCKCKKNVEGERCDRCKSGFFNLEARNPNGCTKCFCSNLSKECSSSGSALRKISSLGGWLVTDLTGERVQKPFIEEDGHYTIADDDMDNMDHYFWSAPRRYLGKRIASYGENLTARVSWIRGRGDTGGKPNMAYDFVIESNETRLAFGVHYYPDDDNVTLIAPLLEDLWTDMATGEVADRDKMMTVLMNLTRILIRAKYHTSQIEASLHLVDLLTCSNEPAKPGESTAAGVERCQCPKGRAGLSCEDCDYGHVMRLGQCEPCDCNGHARSCDPDTGICYECEHNTAGAQCSECLQGYFGNPALGSCKRCACPLENASNNFSPSCMILGNGDDYVCTECPPGYEGIHCERCSKGYFGDPLKEGDSCKLCDCPPSARCHPLTGECVQCPENSAGWNCEQCQDGYYGNPLVGGCKPCECNIHGSTSEICNHLTGECPCREHYVGRTCGECEEKRGNIEEGCPSCDCDSLGSLNNGTCDSVTGHCECKKNVEGKKCEQCLPFHYGMDLDGCKGCGCHESGSLKRQCDIITGQCECKNRVAGRQCDRCQEGFWDLSITNNGCIPCVCDPFGSISAICDQFSGQCPCKPGIGGIYCDQCLHGYYGFSENGCKECEPCLKPGHVCDPDTGRCICPPYTEGEFCERCVPGSYGHHPLDGCKPCSCKGDGVRTERGDCDPYTGKCSCRKGVVGDDCDRCAFGYYGFPDCRPCECSLSGTEPNACRNDGVCQCNSDGTCPCKVNTVGRKCSQCLDGTFGLSEENPDGCTSCFCFGRTQSCIQAQFTWSQLLEPGERRLTVDSGETELNVTNNLRLIPKVFGDVTIGASYPFDTPLYWSLPPPFLGDKILSYNGYLRFSTESDYGSLRFPSSILNTYPLVQIQGNRKLVLEYFPPLKTQSGYYLVRFHESLWRLKNHRQQAVTREILMAVLQNLQSIFIRATESPDSRRAILRDVSLDVAIPSEELATTPLARGVELCFCPSEYNDTSCQNPSIGFYRYYRPGYETSSIIIDLVGEARRCECNGRAESCDRETGYCLDCRDNTGGSHCEECAVGFYGDPSIGACRPCSCPSREKNHAIHCPTNFRSPFEHDCECAPGYTGSRCELCAPGYFGDAIEGSCEPCSCDPFGSISQVCDPRTGNCQCRPGITGRHCTKCAPRHVIMGSECKSCNDDCTGLLLDNFQALTTTLQTLNISHVVPLPWGKLASFETNSLKITQELLDMRLQRDRSIFLLDGPDFRTELDLLALRSTGALHGTKNLPYEGLAANRAGTDLLNTVDETKMDIENTVAYLKNYIIGEAPSSNNVDGVFNEASLHLAEIKGFNQICDSVVRSELEKSTGLLDIVLNMLMKVHVVEEVSGRHNILISRLADLDKYCTNSISVARDAQILTEAGLTLYDFINSTNLVVKSSKCQEESRDAANKIQKASSIFNEAREHLSNVRNINSLVSDKSNQVNWKIRNERGETNAIRRFVDEAKRYAYDLDYKARALFDQFNTTRRVADEPLRAARGYENIVKAIAEARDAAVAANIATEAVLTEVNPGVDAVSVVQKASESKFKSEELIKEAKNLQSSFRLNKMQFRGDHEIMDEIQDILDKGKRTNQRVNEEVDQLQIDQMGALDIFDKAMEVATDASNIKDKVDKTREKISLLRERIARIKKGIKPTQSAEEISRNIDEARRNYELLETQMITSKRKIKETKIIQDKFALDLDELKRKIKKAKQEATGVKVSVTNASKEKKCIRSYLPELSPGTTSSLSLTYAITGKDKNTMLAYLPSSSQSDFLLLEMVNRRIRFVWSSGGSEGSITHPLELKTSTGDLSDDSKWYKIEAERIGSVGRLSVRSVKAFDNEVILGPVTGSSSPAFTRSDFQTGDRLWIGGIPEEYNISSARGIPGCLYQLSLNNQPVGLWNFYTSKNCGPCIEGAEEVKDESAFHFGGNGYAEVPQVPHYDPRQYSVTLSVRSFDTSSILFLAYSNATDQYLMVDLKDGTVRLNVYFGMKHALTLETTGKYNSGKWVKIEATRVRYRGVEKALLVVNDEEISAAPWTKRETPMDLDLEEARLFIGGTSPDFTTSTHLPRNILERHLRGCLKDIQVIATGINPLQGSNYDVQGSCLEEPERFVGFDGRGFLQLPALSIKKDFSLSINFRTLLPDAFIFMSSSDKEADPFFSYYSLALVNERVLFSIQAGGEVLKIVGNQQLNDGILHTATILKQDRRMELFIDETLVGSSRFEKSDGTIQLSNNKHGLFIGGMPENVTADFTSLAGTSSKFNGCISDLIINNEIIGFESLVQMEAVTIGRCKEVESLTAAEAFQEAQDAPQPSSCGSSANLLYEDDALNFGSSGDSFAAIPLKKRGNLNGGINITLRFRTYQSDGLIFYLPVGRNRKRPYFFAVALRAGKIYCLYKTRNKNTVSVKYTPHLGDGEWHSVTIEGIGRKLQIYVDGQVVGKSRLGPKLKPNRLIYLGGIPHDLKRDEKMLETGFQGCIKKLYLDQTEIYLSSSKNVLNNVNKCITSIEEAAYFPADSYAIIDDAFKVTPGIEVQLQFRTSDQSGVLMSVAPSPPSGNGVQLLLKFNGETVELQYGSLVLQTVLSTFLCNGRWHDLRWSVSTNKISLYTDGKIETYSGHIEEVPEGMLIIGGTKGTTIMQPIRSEFTGCINTIKINGSSREWKNLFMKNNVLLDSCPR